MHNKCHEARPVKKNHLHSSRSEPRPSTTCDTWGGEREKRVHSVKNTLKNSSHTPFHLGEWERDRSMEVKQMRRKSGVCFSQRSAQTTVLWRLACLTEIPLRSTALGVNGAFLHLFHSQGFGLNAKASQADDYIIAFLSGVMEWCHREELLLALWENGIS